MPTTARVGTGRSQNSICAPLLVQELSHVSQPLLPLRSVLAELGLEPDTLAWDVGIPSGVTAVPDDCPYFLFPI